MHRLINDWCILLVDKGVIRRPIGHHLCFILFVKYAIELPLNWFERFGRGSALFWEHALNIMTFVLGHHDIQL